MPDTIIENPILNSPFREPDRDWLPCPRPDSPESALLSRAPRPAAKYYPEVHNAIPDSSFMG